jgi:hypothetical protein
MERLSDYRRWPQAQIFGRVALSLMRGRGSVQDAYDFAAAKVRCGDWFDTPDLPELVRGASERTKIERAVRTKASPIGENTFTTGASAEFLAAPRAAAIIGKLPNPRSLPFAMAGVSQITGAVAGWTGEALPKAVTESVFANILLKPLKLTAIVVVAEDAIMAATPDVVGDLTGDLGRAVTEAMDTKFASSDAAVAGVSPAGIAHGAQTIASSGVTPAEISADLRAMLALCPFADCWIMSPAAYGILSFLKIVDLAGTLGGLPVIRSHAAAGKVLLLASQDVAIAGSDAVLLDASREATLDMAGGSNPAFSLWQTNSIGLRTEIFLNFALAGPLDSTGSSSCISLTGASYA